MQLDGRPPIKLLEFIVAPSPDAVPFEAPLLQPSLHISAAAGPLHKLGLTLHSWTAPRSESNQPARCGPEIPCISIFRLPPRLESSCHDCGYHKSCCTLVNRGARLRFEKRMQSDEKNVGVDGPDSAGRPEWPLGQWRTQSTDASVPATILSREFHIVKPLSITSNFLKKDLYPERIHQIEHLLWLAGRPLPPRPLHQQLLLSRQLILSESIDLHLVWKKGTFFVKPLPRYLLDRKFWDAYFRLENDDGVLLVNCARGLLFSYTALVRYESDFSIAQASGLLPQSLNWNEWQQLVWIFLDQFPGNDIYAHVDSRYHYGELRLGRLNKIYRLRAKTLPDLLYGYSNLTAHNQKGDTFRDNLRLIGGSLAYLLIVLQAMQIGLATDKLAASNAFQRACAGFAIFSILAPLIALSTILVVFLLLLVIHVTETLSFERRRFRAMNQTPPRIRED